MAFKRHLELLRALPEQPTREACRVGNQSSITTCLGTQKLSLPSGWRQAVPPRQRSASMCSGGSSATQCATNTARSPPTSARCDGGALLSARAGSSLWYHGTACGTTGTACDGLVERVVHGHTVVRKPQASVLCAGKDARCFAAQVEDLSSLHVQGDGGAYRSISHSRSCGAIRRPASAHANSSSHRHPDAWLEHLEQMRLEREIASGKAVLDEPKQRPWRRRRPSSAGLPVSVGRPVSGRTRSVKHVANQSLLPAFPIFEPFAQLNVASPRTKVSAPKSSSPETREPSWEVLSYIESDAESDLDDPGAYNATNPLRRRGDAPPPSPVKARKLKPDLLELHTNHVQRISVLVGSTRACS
jgi:hypothetical protein